MKDGIWEADATLGAVHALTEFASQITPEVMAESEKRALEFDDVITRYDVELAIKKLGSGDPSV